MQDPLGELLLRQKRKTRALVARLRGAITPDGGLPAESFTDPAGAWSTAQALANLLWTGLVEPPDPFCRSLAGWLRAHQNADGGWPFRSRGESFVDTTAWAVWALSFLAAESPEVVDKGLRWLLDAQRDAGTDDRGGWGIEPRERDRVYSTFVTLLALKHLPAAPGLSERAGAIDDAIQEALRWLRAGRNHDGGWGMFPGAPTDVANTIHALLALSIVGGQPLSEEAAALEVVRAARLPTMTWPTVTEILELRNGFDLRLSWFTTPYACWLWSLALRDGAVCADETLDCIEALEQHFQGDNVTLTLGTTDARPWAICDYLLGQHAASRVVGECKAVVRAAMDRRHEARGDQAREALAQRVREQYPFIIASLFNSSRKIGGARSQRLSALITLFEGTIRYLGAVAVSLYIQSRTQNPAVDAALGECLPRPTLGEWWGMLLAVSRAALDVPTGFLVEVRRVLEADRHKLVQSCEQLLALRNRTRGHGAPELLPSAECERMVKECERTVQALLEAIEFLVDYDSFFIIDSCFDEIDAIETYRIRSCKGFDAFFEEQMLRSAQRLAKGIPGQKVNQFYFRNQKSDLAISLYPFLVYQECEVCGREVVHCYHAASDVHVDYLSYQCGHLTRVAITELFRRRLKRWMPEPENGGGRPPA